MEKLPKLQTCPGADSAAVVTGGNYRITVLTERMLRLEYSEDKNFEDSATQVVLNRDFAPCDYEVHQEDGLLEITTRYLHLVYDRREFSEEGLSVELKEYGPAKKWYYNKTASQGGNFGGTTRTLDDVDGACDIAPGLLARDGWAVLDDSDSLILNDEGWVVPRKRKEIDIYFFGYGQDSAACLKDYYYLTGRPPMLPRYVLGNWWSRYYEYTEQSYKALMEEFEQEKIPFSVAVIDMDWHLVHIDPKYGDGWTGFTWNTDFFPEPEKFLAWLHEKGMHVTLNLHPAQGIHAHERCYPEIAAAMGVDADHEEPVEFDFADPEFVKAYFKYVCYPHEKDGVDFWWIDWQQGSKTKLAQLDPLWMLNHFHFLDSGKNGKRPLTFSRYAGPGSHRYPIGFSGDTHVTWASLDFQPFFTSAASNIGYGWWSHDIGGHTCGVKDDELEARWYQFGVFSPIMRLHSTKNEFNGKEPWRFRRDIAEVMKEFLRLRHKLIPYLYTMNYRSFKEGEPLVQPLYYRHKWQQVFGEVKNEYYFGTDFLVNPVTQKQNPDLHVAKVTTWIPEGDYVDFFTGVIYTGGRRMDMYRDISSIPVLVRTGTIIPMTEQISPEEAGRNPKQLYLRVFAGAAGNFTMYEDDNESMDYLDGNGVFTDFDLDWMERGANEGVGKSVSAEGTSCKEQKCFRIAPVRGNRKLIPAKRSYTIELNAVEISDSAWQDTKVTVDGQTAAAYTEYDKISGRLRIEIPETDVEADICISFPDICRLRKNSVSKLAFQFLDRAEMEFNRKEELYEIVCNGANRLKLLAEIQSLELEPELLGVLTELITAQV